MEAKTTETLLQIALDDLRRSLLKRRNEMHALLTDMRNETQHLKNLFQKQRDALTHLSKEVKSSGEQIRTFRADISPRLLALNRHVRSLASEMKGSGEYLREVRHARINRADNSDAGPFSQ